MRSFRNILVVVKQTPYESYLQQKAQGKAPVALRWERLKNRYETHRQCVDSVVNCLQSLGASYQVVGREEMHRGLLSSKDLVIAVGGDGTVLNTSSFLDEKIPLLGVNSDPSRAEDLGEKKAVDERRSTGALCGATARNLTSVLPVILSGDIAPGIRTRLRCIVRSTYTETKLPPVLNDILMAHPTPAAVSRFRITLQQVNSTLNTVEQIFSFNTWSSGMWMSTATGSSAAIKSAGGETMNFRSPKLQYLVREPISEDSSVNTLVRGVITRSGARG